MAEEKPKLEVLPVVPLRNMVMFPGVVTSLRVGRPRSLSAVEKALQGDRRLVVVAQRQAEVEEAAPKDLYDVGVICEATAAPEDSTEGVRTIVAGGMQRCRVTEWTQLVPYIAAKVVLLEGPAEEVPAALRKRVKELFAVIAEPERQVFLQALPETMDLDDVIAFYLNLPVEDKQRLLAEPSVLNRYRMLQPVLEMESEIARKGRQFWRTTREKFTDEDRERYLRERKEDIENQLTEMEGKGTAVAELRERLKKADLPDEARQEAEREMARLSRMTPGEPEYAVAEDYLDWLLSLPWHTFTEAVLDLERARQVLDRDHYDRAEVKERVLEYLSVRKLNPGREGALLCFVGAPGVGKTSMGRSIADATGRKLYRVALGGIDDEAEIRGHRRTYVGALPGCIIRAMRRIGVANPIIMLDEVDKLVSGLRGDPTSALLEVLDPEQNKAFVDSYLAVPFDLSHVMFIGTANTEDTVPPALLDRLEVIELPGYTTEEKIEIGRRYLWPKQLDAAGLKGASVEITDDALDLLVEQYTREAGVRSLEREIASLCRKLVKEQMGGSYCYLCLDKAEVPELLGPPRYYPERSERFGRPGVCPTLAVSAAGAGLLVVEVMRVEGTGKLTVTGRVGEALRESAVLVLSYWKSRAAHYGYDPGLFRKSDFHVNFPSVERPKEGTSAGLAIALAFASLLRDAPLPEGTAAIGEVTLSGRVLQVDRMAERLAAAERAGIAHVLVPERNRSDIEGLHDRELPPDLKVTYVTSLEDAVRIAVPSAQAAVH